MSEYHVFLKVFLCFQVVDFWTSFKHIVYRIGSKFYKYFGTRFYPSSTQMYVV